jgi:RimJ/RimL family protein N-acetyltransferase
VHFLQDGHQVEIGFALAPSSQGRGFAAEAVVAVLDLLFGQLGKHRVFASADPRNRSSLRLLQRVGMRQEAHFRESVLFKGTWADDTVFAVLRSECER